MFPFDRVLRRVGVEQPDAVKAQKLQAAKWVFIQNVVIHLRITGTFLAIFLLLWGTNIHDKYR